MTPFCSQEIIFPVFFCEALKIIFLKSKEFSANVEDVQEPRLNMDENAFERGDFLQQTLQYNT